MEGTYTRCRTRKGLFYPYGVDREKLGTMFTDCFMSTIETTVQNLEDDSVFVITGDIAAMWLRDSTAQVKHYIPFAAELQKVIEGLIRKQHEYRSQCECLQ